MWVNIFEFAHTWLFRYFKMTCGIYLIVNTINCKVYVGSSSKINRRFSNHKSALNRNAHKNEYLQSAWLKYGELNFKFVIIELCSIDELLLIEQKWIDRFKSSDRVYGYNLSKNADCNVSPDLKTRLKISKSLLGHKHSIETKLKMSLSHKRNRYEHKSHFRKPPSWLGKKHSEETKRKISETLKLRLTCKNI